MTLLLILMLLAQQPSPAAQTATIQRAAWLQGCWRLDASGRTVEEQWMAPRGKTMIGVGRTVRGDTLVEYEFVLLKEQEERLVYEAHPSGQPSAVFLLKTMTDTSIVFENLEHDFPQRVGYERRAPDSLLAWIEGTRQGQVRRVEFPYRRIACPSH